MDAAEGAVGPGLEILVSRVVLGPVVMVPVESLLPVLLLLLLLLLWSFEGRGV